MMYIDRFGNVFSGAKIPDSFVINDQPSESYKLKSNWHEVIPDVWEYDIEAARAKLIKAIDNKTNQIIANGFVFDGRTFSLSTNAQMNWLALKNAYDSNTFGDSINISTKDNTEYNLTAENFLDFYSTAFITVKNALDSGRALKIMVMNATTEEDINAIQDTR